MIKPTFITTAAGAPARGPFGRTANPFISGINRQSQRHHQQHVLHALPQPQESIHSLSTLSTLPTILTSVKIFDGSEITDAVVVSNTFWSTLSSKLPYVLLAQLLATLTFVAIASVAATQGKLVAEQVASNVNDEIKTKSNNKQFIRADELPPKSLDFTKLLLCIIIDIVGSANEAIPLVGELVDIVYAPIAALLLRQLFAGSNIVFLLEFTEEILPFTDVLPLATICWVVESFFASGSLARALKIGEFALNKEGASSDFINVQSTQMENNMNDGKTESLLPFDNDRDNVKNK